MKDPIGRAGSESPARDRRMASATAPIASSLTDHALVEFLFELQQLFAFALHQPGYGDSGGPTHHLGDLVVTDLESNVAGVLKLFRRLTEERLEGGELPIAQFGGPIEIVVAFGGLDLGADALEFLLGGADLLEDRSFGLPVGLRLMNPTFDGPQLLLDAEQPGGRVRIFLSLERLLLDFEPKLSPAEAVDLLGEAIELDPNAARRFVDQVDGLVGQPPIGDVAVRLGSRGDDGRVGDAHPHDAPRTSPSGHAGC